MQVATVDQAPQSVYLNSSFSNTSSSTSNQLNFLFTKALIKDKGDLSYVTLASFSSFNTFNNKCKILNVMYNAVTKVYDYSRIKELIIPDNRYDIGSLMAYLNTYGNYQEQVVFPGGGAVWTSNETGTAAYLYLGFGFDGENNINSNQPILGFIYGSESAKMALQPAITSTVNAYAKVYTSGSIANDQFVYAGVYLVVDADTELFMEAIGFSNKFTTNPLFAPNYKGYGFSFAVTATPTYQLPLNAKLVVALQGPWLLYMTVDSLSNNSRCNDNTLDQMSIIGTIPINNYYGAYIQYDCTFENAQLLDELNTSNFNVTFYDQNKKLVNFRGGQWCACLYITTKSNAKDDLTNQMTANTINTYNPTIGQPRSINNQLKRPNPYGGGSALDTLN